MKFLKHIDNYLICYILVIVAVVQLYNSQFDSLTPWKGGGFGMFSTNKTTNITAVGYKSNGDSILIKVIGSKFNVPISNTFLTSTKNYPKKENLRKLGMQIIHSYLKPTTVEIPANIDKNTLDHINKNERFYKLVYEPKYYENDDTAHAEDAIKIQSLKIRVFETDFFENELIVKKKFIKEIEINY
ncbi:hypothetical protein [Psychroserpens algicola]|uniref:Uncharacterized protein n=1 Tax=Psychroserpens algicola TaxID=1719034 RepID=A0ABT0HA19_9FLAO|nr:hypothetical protein [Psychroserpens algicola]MCK8481203.1 hypothetical protein [Psychroserpens algicola]